MYLRTKLLAATAISFLAFPSLAHAQAFYLESQSAKGAGRAFSGEAADQGADSLWWNPAAIAGSTDGEVVITASAILPSSHVDDTGTLIVRPGQTAAPVGGNARSRNSIHSGILPSGAVSYPIGNRVAFGLAVTSPYSFTTDYDPDSWARYTADKTRLRTVDIQPTIAFAPTDWLRIGVGPNIEYTSATLSNYLPNLAPGLPDGHQSLGGDGWDVGWSAGVQLHNESVTLGLSYKSSIKHNLEGTITTDGLLGPLAGQNTSISGVSASFRTPWMAMAAVRVRATNQLTLNLQGVRYGWEKFDAIRLGAPLNTAIPEDYRNSWSIAGGADYQLSPDFTLRGGVQRTTTPTRDGERDARVPDSNRWIFALGGTYQLSKSFGIDAGANYVAFDNVNIDRLTAAYAGTPVQTPIVVSGRLRDTHAVVLSLGGHFRF